MWKGNLNSMHGILVKEVEDINARLEAEQAEKERLEAERLAAEKAKKEEEARLAKEEEERQKKLQEEQAAEDERLRLLKCKDQPSEDDFRKRATQMEEDVWAEFDPDENGKIDPIEFFKLYRKMIKDKKRQPDQVFFDYL